VLGRHTQTDNTRSRTSEGEGSCSTWTLTAGGPDAPQSPGGAESPANPDDASSSLSCFFVALLLSVILMGAARPVRACLGTYLVG
jgi:hypothetical protein